MTGWSLPGPPPPPRPSWKASSPGGGGEGERELVSQPGASRIQQCTRAHRGQRGLARPWSASGALSREGGRGGPASPVGRAVGSARMFMFPVSHAAKRVGGVCLAGSHGTRSPGQAASLLAWRARRLVGLRLAAGGARSPLTFPGSRVSAPDRRGAGRRAAAAHSAPPERPPGLALPWPRVVSSRPPRSPGQGGCAAPRVVPFQARQQLDRAITHSRPSGALASGWWTGRGLTSEGQSPFPTRTLGAPGEPWTLGTCLVCPPPPWDSLASVFQLQGCFGPAGHPLQLASCNSKGHWRKREVEPPWVAASQRAREDSDGSRWATPLSGAHQCWGRGTGDSDWSE